MAAIAGVPPEGHIHPVDEEREEAPGYEAVRQVLRVLLVLSVAATAVLAVFPVFGMLLLPALFAVLCYVGLMLVTWAERRRWRARHGAVTGRHDEVGYRVVTGGQATRDQVDTGDATTDHEARSAGIPPAHVAGAVVSPGYPTAPDDLGTSDMLTSPQRAGAKVLLRIVAVVFVVAMIVVAALFDVRLLGVGAVIVFAYMALFGLPVWLASMEDAVEDEKSARLR